MRHTGLGMLTATFLAMAGPAIAQGSIEGLVVNRATGAPLANAAVTLADAAVTVAGACSFCDVATPQVTNEDGRFAFTELDGRKWILRAERRGFVSGGGREYLPEGLQVTVASGQALKGVVLKLAPQSVIAGRVTDASAEPLEGVHVGLLKAVYFNGTPQWTEVASATSLDNGEYRIPRVSAGRYLVKATVKRIERAPSNVTEVTDYADTYYPNAVEQALAAPIKVTEGSDTSGADIHMKRVRLFHIRGRIPPPTGGNDSPIVKLVAKGDPAKVFAEAEASTGDFIIDFPRIPPGQYIAACCWDSGLIGIRDITLKDRDVDTLSLTFAPAEITGAITLQPVDSHVDLKGISLKIHPLAPAGTVLYASPVKLGDDLRFQVDLKHAPGFGGFVNFNVSEVPDGCYVASLDYGGAPVPASGAEFLPGATLSVTIGCDAGQVTGIATDADGNGVEGAVVALIASEGIRAPLSMLTGPQGAFQFTGVAPGRYKLMAWDDVAPSDIEDPTFTARLESQAAAVEVQAKATASPTVRVAGHVAR